MAAKALRANSSSIFEAITVPSPLRHSRSINPIRRFQKHGSIASISVQSSSRSLSCSSSCFATPASNSSRKSANAPSTSPTSISSSSATSSSPTYTRSSPQQTPSSQSAELSPEAPPIQDLTSGLSDTPPLYPETTDGRQQVDWTRSFHGLSAQPFSKEAADILLAPLPFDDVEVKPDGILYLPEIKYRRILNRAFGPGGWGLAPRGETIVTGKSVTREYALVAHGRLVSIARGEQDYFSPEGIPTATEGCKSNALMRCCKDLGVASELWDPRYNRTFMKDMAKQVWGEHVVTKKKKQLWIRKGDELRYPYKESKFSG